MKHNFLPVSSNLRSQDFQESHTKFDLVLLHTADIMNVPGAALLETFWQLREVPYVEVVEELTRRSEERFRNVFTKLQAKKLMFVYVWLGISSKSFHIFQVPKSA